MMQRGSTSFIPVLDSRNRRVAGIYRRGARWYGQVWAEVRGVKAMRKRALRNADGSPVGSLQEARAAMERLRMGSRAGLRDGERSGLTLEQWAGRYLESPLLRLKKPGTRENERQALGRLVGRMGSLRLQKVGPVEVRRFVEWRLSGGVSGRTVNLDLVTLRNALRAAVAAGELAEVPVISNVAYKPRQRKSLLSVAEFEQLLEAIPKACRDAQLVLDYVRFLAFTGAREQEALRVRWQDVDFAGRRVWIVRDTKNHEGRAVDFNARLDALLVEMQGRARAGVPWLFPAPAQGRGAWSGNGGAKSLRGSLHTAREAAGLPGLGFHDLRHFFASWCVMAGVDFMTIAEWLGHKDRGILVARVYGHLAGDHKKRMAQRVDFGAGASGHEKARGSDAPGLEGIEWL